VIRGYAVVMRRHPRQPAALLARRFVILALGVALAVGCLACGGDDVDRQLDRARERAEGLREDVRRRIGDARAEFKRRREQFGERIEEVLAQLEPLFERPQRTSPNVRVRGREGATTIDAFLTDVLTNVDRYWTQTFQAADLPEPSVRYSWIAPGAVVLTGCGPPADDSVALYCPADDTIYMGQDFAADLYEGVLENLPGQTAGFGRAAGDFAVAYVVAHEYAHNLQQELGVFDNSVTPNARPFELQADCMAGTWAFSVYAAGDLQTGDLAEATDAALAVGDFDVGNAQHHGTPQERRDALLTGFRSGDPAVCQRFVG
jgi:predicted metalloprotease